MQKQLTTLVAIITLAAGAILSPNLATAGESSDPIKIALTAATDQRVSAHVAGAALRRAKYKVLFVDSDGATLIDTLVKGNLHLQPQMRAGDSDAAYTAATESGAIDVLGPLGLDDPLAVKITWKGMTRKWPGAVKLLRAMNLSSADQNSMVAQIEEQGRSLEEVVADWMDANKKKWKPWTGTVNNWMKAN